ncbi:LysR family transcriptional regulator [Enterobacteriaceae bacterium H11S18]|uniref:LysR family transcriptional regulator n=1 Tax=Enterobacteriaceae TaxID=543 RepID=UPI001927881C|nr:MULTISPECIES: LysR family transcriptional regulator [Enterobacteriaceae]MCT4712220.1 LysR family transcriptional regulator [Dryocola clanedunensis]
MTQEIDVNLLRIIHLLVTNGSVTKTAQVLGLTPGAISHALNKARKLSGQHLFIRTRSGMQPDTLALELSQRYQKYTESSQEPGQDNNSRNIFFLRTISFMEMLVADKILNETYDYQELRHVFVPYLSDTEKRLSDLKSNVINMDVGSKLPPDPLIYQVKLFSCKASLLVSDKSKFVGKQITLDDWYAAKHAVWSSQIDYYCDNVTKSSHALKHIENRNVVIHSSSNINMVLFCATNDCMMLIPDFYIPLTLETFPVKSIATPPELELKYDCYMHFHSQLSEDPAMMAKVDTIIADFNKYAEAYFIREDGVIYFDEKNLRDKLSGQMTAELQ